ncbi:MAG: energy transducer TonB [bacterium]
MKKNISLAIVILFLFSAACSHNIEDMYTAPTVKNQPRLIYPKTAQENTITGKARCLVNISKTGMVEKVHLTMSSGNKDLDEAAVEYCKRLEFNPASLEGEAINSRISMAINFDISGENWDIKHYVKEINNLYSRAGNNQNADRMNILKQILNRHDNFINEMKDGLNFNKYLEQVISSSLSEEWKRDWNSWPLSFLLYHDFIQRFPDYDDLVSVREKLAKAVQEDIRYINSISINDLESRAEKEKILSKIAAFLRINYPDIQADNFRLEASNSFNSAS